MKNNHNQVKKQLFAFTVLSIMIMIALMLSGYFFMGAVKGLIAGGIVYLIGKKNIALETLADPLVYILVPGVFLGAAFGSGNIFLFRILYITVLNYSLTAMVFGKPIERERVFKIMTSGKMLFFYAWIVYGLITLIWVRDFTRGVQEVGLLVKYTVLMILILWRITTLEKMKNVVKGLNLAFVLLMLIGFWEISTGNHLSTSAVPYLPERMRYFPTATFTNPNDFATIITLYLPLLFSMVFLTKKPFYQFLAIVNTIFGVFLIFLVESRTNIVAMLLLTAWIFGGILYKIIAGLKQKKNLSGLKAAGITGIVCGVLFLLFFGRITGIIDSVLFQLQNQQGSGFIRLNLLKNGLLMTKDHYFMGVGAGNVGVNMRIYSAINPTFGVYPIHSLFVEMLAAYGAVIFTSFILWYGWAMKKLRGISRKLKGEKRMYGGALFMGMAAFIISSTSPSSVVTMRTVWLYWALVMAVIEMVPPAGETEGR